MIRRVLIFAVLIAAAPAFAEDIVAYQAEGGARAVGADPRVAALDDAFAHATASALADLLPPDVLAAHRADLDREIVHHARLWVVKFTVTRDETDENRRELSVSVRIDRDRIRARLGELGIAAQAAGPAPEVGQHTATILLRVASPAGVHADFGAAAEREVQGVAALTGALRDAGFAVRAAPASGPAPRPDGDLPIDDASAGSLAAAAGAELALVGGVTVGPPLPVRGEPGMFELVTAHLRMLSAKDASVLGQGTATSVSHGVDPALAGYAIDRALLAAAADALPPAPARLAQAGAYHGNDEPVAEPGVVLVRLDAKTPFALVLAEQHYLAGARGVRGATLRRVSPRGWVIGVATDQPIERIAQTAKRPPATDTTTSVKIAGSIVEVELAGAP